VPNERYRLWKPCLHKLLVIMRSLLIWVSVSHTASCKKSVNKSTFMLEKLRGTLQMKMTATCGIQKFCWRKKIKHLSKYWGGRQHRITHAGQILGGRDPCNPCGVDTYSYCTHECIVSCLNSLGQYLQLCLLLDLEPWSSFCRKKPCCCLRCPVKQKIVCFPCVHYCVCLCPLYLSVSQSVITNFGALMIRVDIVKSSNACFLLSVFIAKGRRPLRAPTVCIAFAVCQSPAMNTPPLFCLTGLMSSHCVPFSPLVAKLTEKSATCLCMLNAHVYYWSTRSSHFHWKQLGLKRLLTFPEQEEEFVGQNFFGVFVSHQLDCWIILPLNTAEA